MVKDKLYFIEQHDEKKRYRGLEVYLQERSGQSKSHGYSYLYARRQQQGLGHMMGLDDKSIETRFEQIINKTKVLMSVYNRHNQVVEDNELRSLYRQCREGLKKDFDLQKGHVTRFYAMVRGRR